LKRVATVAAAAGLATGVFLARQIGRRDMIPNRQALILVPRNREALARLDDIAVHRVARR
jgi:hypothetical protein